MTTNKSEQEEIVNQVYGYAADLMINKKLDGEETKTELVKQGLDEESASMIVSNLATQIEQAKKEKADKDMLHGALWCIGGIIATASDIGFIFWGAILFGAIQFFRGLFRI